MTDSDAYQEQRKQIAAFRKKYENKGIYWVVTDESALREQFSQHLFLYFAKQVAEDAGTSTGNKKPTLTITATDGSSEARLQYLNLSVKMGIEARKQSLIARIRAVQNIALPQESITADDETSTEPLEISEPRSTSMVSISNTTKAAGLLSPKKAASISDDDRDVIQEFCTLHDIDLDSDFWYFGRLQIETSQIYNIIGGEHSRPLVGTDDERQKYELIREIISDIYLYNDSANYYKKMDAIPYVELIVNNEGTTFDEDIEISLNLPHNSLMKIDDFPFPLLELEDIIDNDHIDSWFRPVTTASIGGFDYSPSYDSTASTYIPPAGLLFQQRDYDAEYEQKKEEYYDRIIELFDWEIFSQTITDTLKIRIKNLNQYRSMHLPSRLFLNAVPDRIEYSITAKYTPNVIKGEIIVRR